MKKNIALLLTAAIVASLTACGGSGSSGNDTNTAATETAAAETKGTDSSAGGLAVDDAFGNADTAEYKWKIAIDNNVGTNQYDAAVKFAEKLAELSDGNVYSEIYAGQQLGAGTEVLEG